MAYKKPRYLTPDEPNESSPTAVRTIFLPSDPEQLQALIDGVISTLFEDENFLKHGDMTAEETAQYYRNLNIVARTFCEEMINCFQNDEDTREAMIQGMIAELLADPVQAEAWVSAMRQLGIGTNGGNSQTGEPNSELDGKSFGDCADLDVLYGQCYSATGALTEIIQDVFEWFEIFTNDEELASLLADNIPAIGALPASILETAQWLQNTAREEFESAWDTTSHEFWACKVYCTVLNGDCELTIANIRDAYRAELASFSPPSSTSDLGVFLAWLVDLLTLDSNEMVGACHLFVLEILVRTSEIFGSTWRTLEIAIETSEPIEAPCDDCVCDTPIVYCDWETTANYTVYPITYRSIENYPITGTPTEKAYATGVPSNTQLPFDLTGADSGCIYNWFKANMTFEANPPDVSTRTVNVAAYSDSGRTSLIATATDTIAEGTGVHEFNAQFDNPISGYTTLYFTISATPSSTAYGFFVAPFELSVTMQ